MTIFNKIKSAAITNAHGEVNFLKIEAGSVDLSGFTDVEPGKDGYIVGHSESGHNHILDRGDAVVKERVVDGMKVLYALLKQPTSLRQLSGSPHAEQTVLPGEYLITNNVEYNPFTEQARRVAD